MAKIADAFPLIRNGANIKQGLDDSGYPITRIETISNRTVDRDKMGYAGITDITKYSDYVLQDGDILMSHINSETHLGKVARYEKYEGETIIHGMNLLCLRPNKNLVDSRYASYYLSSEAFLHQIPGITKKSVNQASFNVAALKELTFPISSMEVQQTVADILDKANELIALRKEQLAKLDELIKARFVELFGMINEDVSLSYYIASLNAGKSLAGEEENPNKVLKTGAVTYDYFDATQIKNLPMDYEPQEGHRVKVGDVIISRMNTAELVGAAAYVWDVPEHIYLPDRLWRAEIKETANPIFVWQVLIQRSTKKSIRRIASGTSGSMKNISKPGLLGIRVVKAPIKLQEQFAAFVEQTDKSKVAIQKALDEAQLLFDSLMQKYFGDGN